MPEGYTHVKYANRAAKLAGLEIRNPGAFALGANGPDPLFFYRSWIPSAHRKLNLHPLGNRMHEEKTGAFLQALLKNAKTKTQWDYTLGFLCHYGVDSVMHPLVEAMCREGKPYGVKSGHGYLEIGLDSYEYQQDHGTGAVPAGVSTPILPEGQMLQIAGLLAICIQQVYGVKVPITALRDSFLDMNHLRRLFAAPNPLMSGLFVQLERVFGEGFIRGHVTPAQLWGMDELNQPWTNPFSGEVENEGIFDRLNTAAARCSELLVNANLWKRGYRSWNELMGIIGNNGYVTGLPVESED